MFVENLVFYEQFEKVFHIMQKGTVDKWGFVHKRRIFRVEKGKKRVHKRIF